MSQTKFIYFDVGGVLLLDFSGTNKLTELKNDLGITPEFDNMFEELWNKNRSRICIDFDVDKIPQELKRDTNLNIPENYSMLDDFVNRFEKNESIWQIVKTAKESYKVGLLTNMYPRMFSKIVEAGLIPNIEWDIIIDSSIVGFKKPQTEIYELAEEKSGFKNDEIFFIDNTEDHLNSATMHGWKTFLYDPINKAESSEKLEKEL